MNRSTPAYLFTHLHLAELADVARGAIERRSFSDLAKVLDDSWKANVLIHPSTTNDEVSVLMELSRPYVIGGKLLGAGGGGKHEDLAVAHTPGTR